MSFYDTRAWDRARLQALHDHDWTCTNPACGRSLIGLGQAAQVHHRKALKHAPALALEPQNLRPLCRECHTLIEKGGMRSSPFVALDGTPTDPDHPWNR